MCVLNICTHVIKVLTFLLLDPGISRHYLKNNIPIYDDSL